MQLTSVRPGWIIGQGGHHAANRGHGRFLVVMHTQSQVVEVVAYDERNQVLRARYRDSGETVVYENVPQEVYESLIFANSLGGFFREHIEGRFPARKS